MNKQIEEMALILSEGGCGEKCDCIEGDKFNCHLLHSASILYGAGYRKQKVGRWKQTEEQMGWYDVGCVECSVCGESWVLNDNLDFDLITEYWHYCPHCGAKMEGGE